MRFLILNSDYEGFLDWLYEVNAGLEKQPFDTQIRARAESLFGVADFYTKNLRALGHEAIDIYVNNYAMQAAWAREHALSVPASPQTPRASGSQSKALTPKRLIDAAFKRAGIRPIGPPRSWYEVLLAQIEDFKPDVLLNQTMDGLSSKFLESVKVSSPFLVGQHAAPSLPEQNWDCYDLFVSSNPSWIERFKTWGIPSELHRLGFEPDVLSRLDQSSQIAQVSFVGSFFDVHSSRVRWLEEVVSHLGRQDIDVKMWGDGIENLPRESPIRRIHHGPAWGIEMYRILKSSAMTLNHHGDHALYANNLRLYESTGVGTLLITDNKPNLGEIFHPQEEVITYDSVDECVRQVVRLLDDDDTRRSIADRGHRRTIQDHTYRQRMEQLVRIVESHLEKT